MMVTAMQPPLVYEFVTRMLGRSEGDLGLIFATAGLGGLLGAAAGVLTRGARRPLRAVGGLVALDGLLLGLFALNRSFAGALVLFALFGAISTGIQINLATFLQRETPPERRGRIFGWLGPLLGPVTLLSVLAGPQPWPRCGGPGRCWWSRRSPKSFSGWPERCAPPGPNGPAAHDPLAPNPLKMHTTTARLEALPRFFAGDGDHSRERTASTSSCSWLANHPRRHPWRSGSPVTRTRPRLRAAISVSAASSPRTCSRCRSGTEPGKAGHRPVPRHRARSGGQGAPLRAGDLRGHEGLRASRNGSVHMFLGPDMNMARFGHSCDRMCMPRVDAKLFMEALKRLIDLDDRVPKSPDALYIRPTMISTQRGLGVKASTEYLFYIIIGAVGSYFAGGSKPLRVKAEDTYVRSAPGGVGGAKTGGNYAAALLPIRLAQQEGFDQIVWLDARTMSSIEEMGPLTSPSSTKTR